MDELVNKNTFPQLDSQLNDQQFRHLRLLCVSNKRSTIYVTEADEVFGFGDNTNGCLGVDDPEDTVSTPKLNRTLSGKRLVDMCFGYYYAIALTESGECWSWGNNSFGQLGHSSTRCSRRPQLIEALVDERVVRMSCGITHNLVVTESGQMYAWGRNTFGQCGDSTFSDCLEPKLIHIEHKMVSVSCGKTHSLALTDTGMVYIWGGNKFGQLGRKPVYRNGKVAKIESSVNRPEYLNSSANHAITKALCGPEHTLLLTSEGNVYAFGRNDYGQVGFGTENKQYFPVRVYGKIKFKDIAISCIYDISIGVSTDEKYYIWGLWETRAITRPQEVLTRTRVHQSLFDIYAIYAKPKITYRAIVNNKDRNSSRDKVVDQTSSQSITNESHSSSEVTDSESSESVSYESDSSLTNSNQSSIDSNITEAYVESSEQILKEESNPLVKVFSKSFNNPSNADIKFRINDELVYGHKTLLSIRNEKFWNNYENYLDKQNNEILVNNYLYKSFYAFIRYLYTNIMNFDTECVVDLLSLANSYDEEELKERCCERLADSIDSTNVCQLYSRAIEQKIKELEKYCSEYVSQNFKQIMLTQEFQDMNDSLSKQLIISSISANSKRVLIESTNGRTVRPKRFRSESNY